MTQRVVIANVVQFSGLAEKYPGLLNIPSFAVIKSAITAAKKANCSRCSKVKAGMSTYRTQFESAMSVLSPREKELMKKILSTEKICWMVKNSKGQINQSCF